jgi:hypothetical protein
MIPKFKMKRELKITQWLDGGKIKQYADTLPDGDYEIIIRSKIKWDVDKMRKFLHGPVIEHCVKEFKRQGCVYTKPQIKEWIKSEFGPLSASNGSAVVIPMSTSEWSFETYKNVLQDINDWSIESFGCELPAADEVE